VGQWHVVVELHWQLRQLVQSSQQRTQSASARRCSIVLWVVPPEGHDRAVDCDGLVDGERFNRGKALLEEPARDRHCEFGSSLVGRVVDPDYDAAIPQQPDAGRVSM